jgi:galactokinase
MASQAQVLKTFAKTFSTTPFLFFSPGRINLIGEHIDYNDGFVMPAAIDKGIWFAVAPNYTDTIHVVSLDTKDEFSMNVDSIAKSTTSWKNYILGVLYILQRNQIHFHGFDCVFGGNLPQGAGLSSSAAVECGILFAVNEIFQLGMLRPTMAVYAQQGEHAFPEVKCGIMDQFASMMGKENNVLLLDCKTMQHEYFPLDLKDSKLVLINSKKNHSLASGEYNIRRRQCWQGITTIQKSYPKVQSFRDVSEEMVQKIKADIEEKVFKRTLYVVQEIERTQKAALLLQQDNVVAFGKLMFQTHEGLSKLFEVSTPELDFLVSQAINHTNVLGSRLMGGGFGGCTINIIYNEGSAETINAITTAYKKQFSIDAEVYEVGIGNGTYEIEL